MLSGKELGNRIKKALQDAGKTQAELAEHCGVSAQAVNSWLKTGRVSKGRLDRIARFTNRDLSYLLSDKNLLTGLAIEEQDADAVRAFLSANTSWRELWLAVVKKNDARLVRIVELYERASEEGKKMILNGARGAALLPEGQDEPSTEPVRRPHRKRT